jgi:hypothetical protein
MSANRRPTPLNLAGGGGAIVKPRPGDATTRCFSVSVTEHEYREMQAFVTGVRRWTGRTITLKAIVRSACRDYVRRNRSWVEMTPETAEAAD